MKEKKPISIGRIAGYALIVFGAASILDAAHYVPIPTVGWAAILSGAVSVLAGLILIKRNKSLMLQKLRALAKKWTQRKPPVDPLLPVRILKLARENRGVLTAALTAVELNVPLSEAEAGLDACVAGGYATVDFNMEKEIKFYRFPEFLPPPEP